MDAIKLIIVHVFWIIIEDKEKKVTAFRDFSFNIPWDRVKARELEREFYLVYRDKATNDIGHWTAI